VAIAARYLYRAGERSAALSGGLRRGRKNGREEAEGRRAGRNYCLERPAVQAAVELTAANACRAPMLFTYITDSGFRWGGLQPAADFSPPAAGFASFAGGRAEARGPLWGRLKSAPRLGNRELLALVFVPTKSRITWNFVLTRCVPESLWRSIVFLWPTRPPGDLAGPTEIPDRSSGPSRSSR